MTEKPILWSFRRCPYAIRARLAIQSAGIAVDLREILLRDKPDAFLAASPSATVPCLQADTTLDESRDIMLWALHHSDPSDWLAGHDASLMDACDGPFKQALDHTKYHVRFPALSRQAERAKAAAFLQDLDHRLIGQRYLTGDQMRITDAAILPFVRQFANIDRAWFDAQSWPHLIRWLDHFTASAEFANVMMKYPVWQPGQPAVRFPA